MAAFMSFMSWMICALLVYKVEEYNENKVEKCDLYKDGTETMLSHVNSHMIKMKLKWIPKQEEKD